MPDWNTIIEQHGQLVWRTAYRLLGNHDDASDCFQETFISALAADASAGQDRIENWGGFLRRLATARALDRLRQRLRQSARCGPLGPADTALPSPAPGPLPRAESQELNQQIRQALAELPPKQAEAFCLHYLDQLSYDEIAQHLEITTNAVGSLLHRSRASLRVALSSVASEQES